MEGVVTEEQIKEFLLKFGDKFELLNYGINENYKLNGCWLKSKTKSPVRMNSFPTGAIEFSISDDIITINKGFLSEM